MQSISSLIHRHKKYSDVNRLRSASTVYRFRMAALVLFLMVVLGVVSVGVVIFTYLVVDRELAFYGLIGLLAAFVLALILCLMSSRTNCPRCMIPVLSTKACSKNDKAKAVFGSHRFRVALSILFKDSFTCPYCLEPTAMKARPRATYKKRR